MPHRRHSPALAALAKERRDKAKRRHALEERFADVDFDDEIRPVLNDFSLREISERTGFSRSYVEEIRHGEKVPRLELSGTLLRIRSTK